MSCCNIVNTFRYGGVPANRFPSPDSLLSNKTPTHCFDWLIEYCIMRHLAERSWLSATSLLTQGGVERVREAAKLGLKRALLPKDNQSHFLPDTVEVVPVQRIADALEQLYGW